MATAHPMLTRPAADLDMSSRSEAHQPIARKLSSPGPTAKVGIILVNWNGWPDTLACLKSLEALQYRSWVAIVVDNASSDDSLQHLRALQPRITLIESAVNTGWAGGNNLGIKAALSIGCDYVWLLNNDAVALPESLSELVRLAQAYPDAAFIGSVIDHFEPQTTPLFAGRLEDEATGIPEDVPRDRLTYAGPACDAWLTDYVAGASILTSRSMLERVGLIDEDFFLNFDEVDWCRRAAKMGLKSIFSVRALVRHKSSASMGGKHAPLNLYFSTRNRLLYARKHCTRPQRRFIWKLTLWELDRTARNEGHRSWWVGLVRRSTPLTRVYALGVRDAVLRRFGDCPAQVRAIHQAFKRREADHQADAAR